MARNLPSPTDTARSGARTTRDDIDDEIYRLRVVEHLPWRDVAVGVGYSPNSAHMIRDRFTKLMHDLRPTDWEALRTEESTRLDDLETKAVSLLRFAIEQGELTVAMAAIREAHAITRTRIDLWGLKRTSDEPADLAAINDLIEAYTIGVTDGQQSQQETA